MITAAMAARVPPGRQLSSWKEIAAYFGVSERTVQKWERERGLPVHRLPGERGRVVAWSEELDRWRASALDRPSWWVNLPLWRGIGAAAAVLACIAVVAAAVLAWRRASHGPPAGLVLDGRTLKVTDEHGRELWRHLFDEPFVPGITPADLIHQRTAAFADLDGDGSNELLFVYRPASEVTRGNILFCFSGRGRVLWRYQPTRSISTRVETFSPVYLASFLVVLPPSGDGARRIAYASHHVSYYPAHVALLTARGEVQAEYWHSGHLIFGEAARLEGLQKTAVLLAGISNSFRTSTLIALDPERPWCASDESEHPDYQLDWPARNCELARILFPRTCISRRLDPYSRPLGLVVHPGSILFGTLERSSDRGVAASFRFDRQLRLQSAEVTDLFLAHHRELEAAGQLDHPFSDAELRLLRQIRVLRHWSLSATPPDGSATPGSPGR